MANFKAILFDNDGVLAHTEQFWLDANCQTMASLDIPYTREDFIKHTFVKGWGSAGWLKRQGYPEEIIRIFGQQRNVLWKAAIHSANVTDPNALNILIKLKKNYRLAVVTNTGSQDFRALHRNAGELLDLFDVMILREHYQKTKPAPDAYLAAIKALEIEPAQAIVVEDSPRSIASARKAGLSVIAIRNPDFPLLDLTRAQHEISSLNELPCLIVSL